MSLFSREMFRSPITIEEAWKLIASTGKKHTHDKLLFSEDFGEVDRIIWMERLWQFALAHGGSAILGTYKDFRDYSEERRPDPNKEQWLFLYSKIAECNIRFQETIQLMACRDALLPFLESIPDNDFSNAYHQILSPWPSTCAVSTIPYQSLEAAIQENAPTKVTITKMMCRNVTDEAILNRAIALEKGAVVASMLRDASVNRIVAVLITTHTNWENPAPLFEHILPQYEDEIAAWRDPWGNGFFWYLYRRPFLSRAIIEGLPPKVLATFGTKNRYEISPEDLWTYFRPAPES